VQELTPPLAAATGANTGVVIAWVDQDGPARNQLTAGEVIEAIDGRALPTRQHWDVRVARLAAGETLTLGVRGRNTLREVRVTASAPVTPAARRSLGLTLRARPTGAEVIGIEHGSAAQEAGLHVGDVITLVGPVAAPTPAQVARSFAALDPGQRVLVAVARAGAHSVTTLQR
jgi:serine protease Do